MTAACVSLLSVLLAERVLGPAAQVRRSVQTLSACALQTLSACALQTLSACASQTVAWPLEVREPAKTNLEGKTNREQKTSHPAIEVA